MIALQTVNDNICKRLYYTTKSVCDKYGRLSEVLEGAERKVVNTYEKHTNPNMTTQDYGSGSLSKVIDNYEGAVYNYIYDSDGDVKTTTKKDYEMN